jgi:hypothetical protein
MCLQLETCVTGYSCQVLIIDYLTTQISVPCVAVHRDCALRPVNVGIYNFMVMKSFVEYVISEIYSDNTQSL